MKLIYICSSELPSRAANGIHVMRMCQAFARAGAAVTLLAPNKLDDKLGVRDLYSYYGVDESFGIRKLAWLPIKGRAVIYGFLAALTARLKRPELVYGRNLFGCFFSALLGLPVVLEIHAPLETGRLNGMIFCRLLRSARLKALVVITDALRQHYQAKYPTLTTPILVAADGADPVSPEGEPVPFAGRAERLQVGYVGHLYHGRGIELIEALASACPWADFHVIGGTEPDIAACEARTAAVENFHVHGFKPPRQVEAYRRGCDVLLAPYQASVSVAGGSGNTVQWMSPLKIFEYMAAGKAIISSDLPVLREVLEHGRNAWLCRPGELEDWVGALTLMHDSPEQRMALGENALFCFNERYSWTSRASYLLRQIVPMLGRQ